MKPIKHKIYFINISGRALDKRKPLDVYGLSYYGVLH
jgi:hypothetical protein